MKLPGGFSPVRAVQQVGSYVNPTGGVADYNVFSDYSVRGGDRSPADGSFIGADPTATSAPSGGGAPAPTTSPQVQSAAVVADPYARWGGQAAYQSKVNNYGVTQEGYRGGAQTQLRDVTNELGNKGNAFVTEVENTQGDINRGMGTNELNLRRSMQNIVRGIQNGIRSGGVALAGMNASESGAADALARAYAKVGNTQTGEARGQAATVLEDLMRKQGQLNTRRVQGEQDIDTWADTESGRVRSDFGNKLNVLGAQAEGEGLGGTVNRGLVDQVLGEALARIQQLDAERNQRMSGIRQWTPEEVMAEAIRLDNLGVAGNAFQVTGPDVSYGGPSQGAPIAGELPIYVRGKDQGIGEVPLTRTKVEQAVA